MEIEEVYELIEVAGVSSEIAFRLVFNE